MANTRWARFILPAFLAVGAFVVFRKGGTPPPPVAPAPSASQSSTPASSALEQLASLKLGDSIGEWKLAFVRPDPAPNGGPQLRLEFERKGSYVAVWLAARGKVPLPPIETAKYQISYGSLRVEGEALPPDTVRNLAQAVADRVKAHEASVPMAAVF